MNRIEIQNALSADKIFWKVEIWEKFLSRLKQRSQVYKYSFTPICSKRTYLSLKWELSVFEFFNSQNLRLCLVWIFFFLVFIFYFYFLKTVFISWKCIWLRKRFKKICNIRIPCVVGLMRCFKYSCSPLRFQSFRKWFSLSWEILKTPIWCSHILPFWTQVFRKSKWIWCIQTCYQTWFLFYLKKESTK